MPDELRAVVYVSWGLWVADCPRPHCLGAEHYGHAPITGHVGGLTLHGFRCSRCGGIFPAQWPANVETIWRLLAVRPLPETRNWRPGETTHDLMVENAAHGILDSQAPGGIIIGSDGEFTDLGRQLVPPPGRSGPLAIGGQ